jgi:hypothetical protein
MDDRDSISTKPKDVFLIFATAGFGAYPASYSF